MGRPGRTLLILAVTAVGGVLALLALADRYNDLLDHSARRAAARPHRSGGAAGTVANAPVAAAGHAPERTAGELLDAFVAVRLEMRRALDAAPGASAGQRLDLLREARGAALVGAGLEESEYRQVREVWRRARRGEGGATPAFAEAFAERTERLTAPDLGAMEAYDP